MLAGLAVFTVLGLSDVGPWTDWQVAVRWALAAMFLVTAGARLSPLRHDMVAMVPAAVPAPGLLVALGIRSVQQAAFIAAAVLGAV